MNIAPHTMIQNHGYSDRRRIINTEIFIDTVGELPTQLKLFCLHFEQNEEEKKLLKYFAHSFFSLCGNLSETTKYSNFFNDSNEIMRSMVLRMTCYLNSILN